MSGQGGNRKLGAFSSLVRVSYKANKTKGTKDDDKSLGSLRKPSFSPPNSLFRGIGVGGCKIGQKEKTGLVRSPA